MEHRPEGSYFESNCKLFEFVGIICCHVMKVIVHKDMRNIPERHIKCRWKRDIFRPHLGKNFKGGYPQLTPEFCKYKDLRRLFDEAFNLCVYSPQMME